MILASCVGLAITMSLTTWILVDFRLAYPLFFVTMVLVAMRISPFSALLTAMVADDRRGSLMSMTIALGQVAFGVGGAIAGPIYAARGYEWNTIAAAASVLLMGVVVWLRIPEPPLRGGEHARP